MNLSVHFQFTESLATIFVESWIKGWMNDDYQLSVNQANWIIQRYTVSSCPAGGLLFNPSWHICPLCWYSPNVRSYININSALVSFLDDLYIWFQWCIWSYTYIYSVAILYKLLYIIRHRKLYIHYIHIYLISLHLSSMFSHAGRWSMWTRGIISLSREPLGWDLRTGKSCPPPSFAIPIDKVFQIEHLEISWNKLK
jgi:hypothetical protein